MNTTTTRPGLRERKKAETRQAVHQAALRLVVEQGFDAVTVEQIADAANISRRTFSNYFAGKEDALLYGEEQRFRQLVERVRSQPPQLSAWQAMRTAIMELYEELGEVDREWAMRTRLAKKHPTVLARQLANHAALERELAQVIAGRAAPARCAWRPSSGSRRRSRARSWRWARRSSTRWPGLSRDARPENRLTRIFLPAITLFS
jgi:AcrR family transcriptional regulator